MSFNLEDSLIRLVSEGHDFFLTHTQQYIKIESMNNHTFRIGKNFYEEIGCFPEGKNVYYSETVLWFILYYCNNIDLEFSCMFLKTYANVIVYNKQIDSGVSININKDLITLQIRAKNKIIEITHNPQDFIIKAPLYVAWLEQ